MLLDIGQIIDLACGTPEAGVINFNALHALLHIFRQQLKLGAHRVEFGDGCQHMADMCDRIPEQQPYDIQAFSVQPDRDGSGTYANRKPKRPADGGGGGDVNTVLVVQRKPVPRTGKSAERRKSGKEKPAEAAATAAPATSDGGAVGSSETRPGAEDGDAIPDDPGAEADASKIVAARPIDVDEDDQNSDANSDDTVSSKSQSILSDDDDEDDDDDRTGKQRHMSKRLDAAEKNIGQLFEAIKNAGINCLPSNQQGQTKPDRIITPSVQHPCLLADFNVDDFVRLRNDFDYIRVAVQRLALCSGQPDIASHLQQEINNLKAAGTGGDASTCDSDGEDDARSTANNVLGEELTNRMQALDRSVESLERRMAVTDKRMYDMEKEFGDISGRTDKVLATMEAKAGQEMDTAAMLAQLSDFSRRIQRNGDACVQLQLDRDDLLAQSTAVAAQLQLVEHQKIDRAEAEELLAEKADYNLVKRKVSSDQFDAAKRELSHGLSEALAQLAAHESRADDWRLAMHAELSERTTHGELELVRDQLTERLQAHAEKLRALSVVRAEPEAAGTRMRLLRNAKCVSCEQSVVQRREEGALVPCVPKAQAMRTKRPQQVFEQDRVRAELNGTGGVTNPGTVNRNLHHFEQMMKGTDKVHMCERYCGGSHTMIGANASGQRQLPPRGAAAAAQAKAANGLVGTATVMHGTDGTVYKVYKAPFEKCICAEKLVALPEETQATKK